MSERYGISFLASAMTENNPFISTEEALLWLREQKSRVAVRIDRIPLEEAGDWAFDPKGNYCHKSGKFFSIEGVSVSTNYGTVPHWEQPIINQPEVGFLGIICKEVNGVLLFLLQAKVEPGNINTVQLSPTLQATKSNYTQVHKGRKPLYLEYFVNARPDQVLLDQLQSEQGARFLKKRNRNIIIKVDDDIEVYDNYIWLTLGQIKKLCMFDNIVNMDTRTVISGIPFPDTGYLDGNDSIGISFLDESNSKNTTTDIISWMTALKCKYELSVSQIPLLCVEKWHHTDGCIVHESGKYFSVIAADINVENREVQKWSQPLIMPHQIGLVAFIVKKINGTYHFLIQGKVEVGNFDILEMAPTVQCVTDSYAGAKDLPFLDYVLNASEDMIRVDTFQSEEGGRFYQEQNRNMIVEASDDFDESNLPENYIWMTYRQLMNFIQYNNYLNIQARSLISLIQFI